MRDDLGRAALPETGDPVLAEWLEEASCSARVKVLAVRAADAAGRGVSADQRYDPLGLVLRSWRRRGREQ